MSLLSGIKKLFSKIMDFLKKLLKWLGPIILVALIIIAIFFPAMWAVVVQWASAAWTAVVSTVGGWLTTAWGWLVSGAKGLWSIASSWLADASFTDVLKLAAGAAVILDPEGAADAIGSVVGGVVDAVGDVAEALLGENWPWILAGGAAFYFLVWRKRDEGKTTLRIQKE